MLASSGKSPLAISLAVLACLVLSSTVFAEQGKAKHHPRDRKTLGKKLSGIHVKRKEAKAALKQTREEAHEVKLNIIAVDTKLEATRNRLESTKDQLSDAKKDRDRTADQLDLATKKLKATKTLVEARIRHIYMQGDAAAMSAISGTKTAGDVASQGFLMDAIKRKDRDVFNSYIDLQKQVAERKKHADQVVIRIARLEDAQKEQATSLATDRQGKANLLNDLRAKQKSLEGMIHQFEQDESQIQSEIEAYQRELARRIAEQNRNRKHGGGSHGGGATVYTGTFSGRFSRPVSAPITSTFGMRYHPILHRVRMHTGIDFGASYGTTIHAAAAGEVIFTTFMNGYGHVVIIDHGGGYSTVYAHTSRVFVSNGQRVSRGQSIAAVGASGLATGPHLHWEVRLNGRPINPMGKL